MSWRLIEVPKDEARADDLTDSELIGVNVILTHNSGLPLDQTYNVYWRARLKMQPQVEKALSNG